MVVAVGRSDGGGGERNFTRANLASQTTNLPADLINHACVFKLRLHKADGEGLVSGCPNDVLA
ncbi:hypothetical protein E2C01_085003 [Portunus trituberculatus]|uniref:Uncharacterized protein n=1 Tax=Portunus trituberculatus TaxID=210409 RepID=A0A5B7J7Q8_PORTR|nr:hypothetical protein [Portunus trituberculatus]